MTIISWDELWSLCPEAAVAVDTQLAHLEINCICRFDFMMKGNPIGMPTLTIVPVSPEHPDRPGRPGLCIDWYHPAGEWRCHAMPSASGHTLADKLMWTNEPFLESSA